MKTKSHTLYRISGLVGLVLLAIIAGWLEWGRTTPRKEPELHAKAREHDHSDPEQHAQHADKEEPAKPETHLKASGKLVDGNREVHYEAFRYAFKPDPLVVRAGETVKLTVVSTDVKHGMMIPAIDFNAEILPKKAKKVEFKAPSKPGRYPIYCSVYCGSGHGNMQGTLLVLPRAD